MERLDARDAWILAATTAAGAQFVIGYRLKGDTGTLDANRIAGFIEEDSRDTDPGIVASCDPPRKQVKLTIRAGRGARIQDAFGLQRIARLRFHHHAEALHLKVTHPFFADWFAHSSSESKRDPGSRAVFAVPLADER